MKGAYSTYLRYKKVIEMLDKKERTSLEIIKETRISSATIFRILQILLKNKVIIILKNSIQNKNGRPAQVFKLNRKIFHQARSGIDKKYR